MTDTSHIFDSLKAKYSSTGSPIPVSFRALVPWIPYNSPRYTHQVHSYPAKVIPQIPHFFMAATSLIRAESTILDPFGGSGTVAVEACLKGHTAIVSDSNPLARLLTRVKTTPISGKTISQRTRELRKLVAQSRRTTPPEVVNISYWYHPSTIRDLSRLVGALSKLETSPFKKLCLAALSTTTRKMSLADPRVSVPVRLKPKRYNNAHPLFKKSKNTLESLKTDSAIDVFFDTLNYYSSQVESLYAEKRGLGKLTDIYSNSFGCGPNALSNHPEGTINAIVTSPPYLGAQKYIRASSLSLGWLSMAAPNELRALEDQSIGREHFPKKVYAVRPSEEMAATGSLIQQVYDKNPLRAHIAATYLSEMRQALAVCSKLLKKDGVLVLVSGCNMLAGHVFDTTSFLRQICIDLGLVPELEVTDVIKSRGLMTRRNKTAHVIPLESVIVFRK